MIRIIFLIILALTVFASAAQVTAPNDPVALIKKAETANTAKQYDSALIYLRKAELLLMKGKPGTSIYVPILYNQFGSVWLNKSNYGKAQAYYEKALQLARLHNYPSEAAISFGALNALQHTIVQEDLPFNYPVVSEKEQANIAFPVLSSRNVGDSIEVVIAAGKYDGIVDSKQEIELFTRDITKDTSHHSEMQFISSGNITSLTNNRTIIKVEKTAIPIYKDDIAYIKAQIPAGWRTLNLRTLLLNGVYLVDNYRLPIYSYRYFYYYGTPTAEEQAFENMKLAVDEVVAIMAEDTLTNSEYSAKIPSGIFTGYNVMSAMSKSSPQHINLFLRYVTNFYGKYINNNFRFSETFATWIINRTPLKDADVKTYLFTAVNNKELLLTEVDKMAGQIIASGLADKWLDEGMQAVAVENTEAANNTALLLNAFYQLQKDTLQKGWVNYLHANVAQKLSRFSTADSLLALSKKEFELGKNEEGLRWVAGTKEFWQTGKKINAGIQNGNLFGFEIAQSYDPRFFATGGADNMIKIWDRNLGKEIKTLSDHSDEINSLEYSSNGRYLASVGQDKIINVYNAYNYSRIYQLKTKAPEQKLRFSPNNELMAVCGSDNDVRLLDFKRDSIVKVFSKHTGIVRDIAWHPIVTKWLYSAGQDSMVYRWNIETGEMQRWYKLKGKVLSIKISSEGKYMSTVSTDSLLTVWDLETNKKWMTSRIHVFKQGTNRHYASESFSADHKYISYPYAKDSFVVVRLRDLVQRAYPTNVGFNNLADVQFSKDGRLLFARFSLGSQIRLYNFVNWDIQQNTTISYKDIRSFSNFLVGLEFNSNDNQITITHSGISRVDLRNGKTQHLPSASIGVAATKLFFEDDNRFISFCEYEPCLRIEDLAGKLYASYSLPEKEKVGAFDMSADNSLVFMAGKNGNIFGWNVHTGKNIFGKSYDLGGQVSNILFDDYRKQLLVVGDSGINILDTAGQIVKTMRLPEASYVVTGNNYLYVTTRTGYVQKYDLTGALVNQTQVNKAGDAAYQLLLNKAEDRLYVQSSNNHLALLDARTLQIIYNIFDHDYGGTMLALSNNEKILASAGFDSKIKLYTPATGAHLADIYIPMEREAVIIDTDGYYLSQKSSLDALLFSYNNNSYSFEQFDAQFNRPHTVLKKIGFADSTTLRLYEAAFEKRLSRLRLKEQPARALLEVPIVRILDKSAVETITTKNEFTIQVECSDNRFPIANLQVWVNNTPISASGFHFKDSNSLFVRKEVRIPLSSGDNNIKVFCTNSMGARSLSEQIQVFAKHSLQKPAKTYFIGIAVDQYKDSSMNLKYSVKDVRDLAKTFRNLYNNIDIDTFINRRATKENILAIRKKLLNSTVNDRVILAITGHGLLSKSFDFYYATWDNVFTDPQRRGIKYDDLESLLNDIPARQKLMLIDACHSGALDKEELVKQNLQIQADSSLVVNGVVPRGVIKIGGNKDAGTANTFEMMQKLFTDLDGNNGAVIISAAGGMEYALESAKWNNGVFTYCVRKGIEEKAADRQGGNYDGQVSVQELQQYVSRKVPELTGGKQQPTNRRENIDFEWFLAR